MTITEQLEQIRADLSRANILLETPWRASANSASITGQLDEAMAGVKAICEAVAIRAIEHRAKAAAPAAPLPPPAPPKPEKNLTGMAKVESLIGAQLRRTAQRARR